jgi:hypothetical protein
LVTQSPPEVAEAMAASLSDIAADLYTVDSGTDMLFVQRQADSGNATAAAIVASLATAWEQYPLAKSAVDDLQAALGRRDHQAVDGLLGPAAVTLPDGSTVSLGGLITALAQRAKALVTDSARLADKARAALSKIDAAKTTATELESRAAAIGVDDDGELRALHSALDRCEAAVADDPAGEHNLGELDRLVAEARDRIETLERHRDEVPRSLASAAVRLRDLEALIAQGSEAYARARDRISSQEGLLQPLDLDAEGDRGLRPWLARLEQQVEAGASEASFNGLVAWHKTADEWFANAKRVADANAAPVGHRNELRGLLDAFRAKAGAHGRDEDPELDKLYSAAKDALYTAPCDLSAAESIVREYVTAVNAGREGRPA